jgi:RNA polymerase sigma-70 factor (ECF subfamily)
MTLVMIERTVPVEADEDQLARFVEADYGPLVAALSLICGDRGAAEDAVQEALAKALIAMRRGTVINSMPAWVRVASLNHLRNRWRSIGRERRAVRKLKEQNRSRDGEDLHELLDLQAAVAGLSRRQREAVALHYRLGLSIAETALAMQVTDGTVKTLLSRARATLAQVLDAGEDGHG